MFLCHRQINIEGKDFQFACLILYKFTQRDMYALYNNKQALETWCVSVWK
jgi:hypothetical protein